MASVNKVILVGNLGRDPEMKSMPSGDAVATLNIATTERWRDKATGTQRESTDWHRVVMFRRLAEIAGQYLHKGSQVYIEGRLRHRKWQDDKGQTRYTTEVEASEMKMLGSRTGQPEGSGGGDYSSADQARGMPSSAYDGPPPDPGFRDMQDDVPF